MKKLIFILSLFGFITLVGCNNPDTNTPIESTPSIDDSVMNNESVESSTKEEDSNKNDSSNNPEQSKDDSEYSSTSDKEPSTTLPDYDDGRDWHGTVD